MPLAAITNITANIRMPDNANSLAAFENDLRAFFKLPTLNMLTAEMVIAVSIEDVTRYKTEMKAAGLKNSTICRRLATLKRMYEALAKANIVKLNPADRAFVDRPDRKEDERTTEHLEPADLEKMFAAPDDSWIGRRDFCLMTVALATGLRRRELCAIRLEQLRPEGQELTFMAQTKRSKWRKCWLGAHEITALERWKKVRGAADGPLFLSQEGDNLAITPGHLWKRIHLWASEAGVQRETRLPNGKMQYKVTPHSFRASCVVNLLMKGYDIDTVRKYIGHESIETTSRYARHLGIEGAAMVRALGDSVPRPTHGNPKRIPIAQQPPLTPKTQK